MLREHTDDEPIPDKLLAPSASLPGRVLLPAYARLLVSDFADSCSPIRTSRCSFTGNSVASPTFRFAGADLLEDSRMNRDHWCDVVALLPPTAAECMSVPISRARRWLAQAEDGSPDLGDLLEVVGQAADGSGVADRDRHERGMTRGGVLWRGAASSQVLQSPDELRPGDTLVLPVAGEGWRNWGTFRRQGRETRLLTRNPSLVRRIHPMRLAESTSQNPRSRPRATKEC